MSRKSGRITMDKYKKAYNDYIAARDALWKIRDKIDKTSRVLKIIKHAQQIIKASFTKIDLDE
jgi:hypothetical protein